MFDAMDVGLFYPVKVGDDKDFTSSVCTLFIGKWYRLNVMNLIAS